jgi:acetyl-CoA carboxylase/biotin carboxylase 1
MEQKNFYLENLLFVFSLKEILEWRTSREFFYWRLKRRLEEDHAIKLILTANHSFDYQISLNQLQQWFNEDKQNDVGSLNPFFLMY